MSKTLSRILFPLRTNIKSLQTWGENDISERIRQSIILYDEVVIEAGTYRYTGAERFVLEAFSSWNEKNSKEDVLEELKRFERKPQEGYITVRDGKTHAEKYRYKVDKNDEYVADYRTVDIISEIESGSYGKEVDFLKYAIINRKDNHNDVINKNVLKDLENKEFRETAIKTYGQMPLITLMRNLNDSLAISQNFRIPVMVDAMHAPLLRIKTEAHTGLEFAILDRLSQIGIPDFSKFGLDRLLKLRKDKAIKSFRNKIFEMNSRLQSETTLDVEKIFTQDLMEEIEELAPTKRKVFLEATLGALSFIPSPVASIVTTSVGVGKELKDYRDFATNWLSFVLRAKRTK